MSDDQTAEIKPRKVGFLLGAGIFFVPIVFAWFTLRKGHSKLARVLSLGWLGLGVAFWVLAAIGSNNEAPTDEADSEAPMEQAAAEASTEQAAEEAAAEQSAQTNSSGEINNNANSVSASLVTEANAFGRNYRCQLAAVEIGNNAQPVQNEKWATLALERNRVAFVKDSATNELPFIKRDQTASGVALTYGEMTDSTANVVIFLIKSDTSMAPMVIHNLVSSGVKVGEYWNCSPA